MCWQSRHPETYAQITTRTETNGRWGPIETLGGVTAFPFASSQPGGADLWGESAHFSYQHTYVSGTWSPRVRPPY